MFVSKSLFSSLELSNEQHRELCEHVCKQISLWFKLSDAEVDAVKSALVSALSSTFRCIEAYSNNKYYVKDTHSQFSVTQSSQYCIFLYWLSRYVRNSGLADKIYYLNKIMHSVDIYHHVELPQVFDLNHPVGAVLGKAKYGNYFAFRQGCTVGNNRGSYPIIGNFVKMWSNSKILGKSMVGDVVIFSANSYVIDANIPSFSLVFGQGPDIKVVQKDEDYFVNRAIIPKNWKSLIDS